MAQHVKQQRGEERKGTEGADGEVGRTLEGLGLLLFFFPRHSRIFKSAVHHLEVRRRCWMGDTRRKDTASRRWDL